MGDGVDAGAEGGEAACYLPMVGEQGEIADPRGLIQLARKDASRQSVPVLHRGLLDALLPCPGESIEEYRARLEAPTCRTAAWAIILAARDRPFAIDLGDQSDQERYGPVLVEYLRSLVE